MTNLIPCNFCLAKFRNTNTWALHTCKELKSRISQTCPCCKSVFTNSARMVKHFLSRECLEDCPKDQCNSCSMAFVSSSHKTIHVQKYCHSFIIDMIHEDGSDLFDDSLAESLDNWIAMQN